MSHGMKKRTIKSVLRRKIDHWLASVENEALRERLRQEVIVTGGCIPSMLMGEPVNDFDVYVRTKALAYDLCMYYVEKFKAQRIKRGGVEVPMYVEETGGRVKIVVKSAGVEGEGQSEDYHYFESRPDHDAGAYVDEAFDPLEDVETLAGQIEESQESEERPPYRPVFLSTNSISLSDRVQIVVRFFGDPEEIHENYDFTHCTCYWESKNNNLVLPPAALECLLARELRYQGSKYPLCSVIRTRKFIERGWRVNAGQYLKMCMQISELNLTSVEILEDQLTGVDVAYFAEMIERLKDKHPERVDTAYLVEIVDRMF